MSPSPRVSSTRALLPYSRGTQEPFPACPLPQRPSRALAHIASEQTARRVAGGSAAQPCHQSVASEPSAWPSFLNTVSRAHKFTFLEPKPQVVAGGPAVLGRRLSLQTRGLAGAEPRPRPGPKDKAVFRSYRHLVGVRPSLRKITRFIKSEFIVKVDTYLE